ncbi:hypothetical protein GGI05_001630 [Coemansia sp. RSA 2603]|nr:hypothetical protein GGI05_001630 [Coemansia sp. RSA 2603]
MSSDQKNNGAYQPPPYAPAPNTQYYQSPANAQFYQLQPNGQYVPVQPNPPFSQFQPNGQYTQVHPGQPGANPQVVVVEQSPGYNTSCWDALFCGLCAVTTLELCCLF